MGYSDAEIRVFEEKEKRIVRQSCLKVAVVLVSERPNFRDDAELDSLALVKEMAGELVEWVYEKASEQPDVAGIQSSETVGDTQQLPEPTLAQKKVLDAIANKQGKELPDQQLLADVLRWAEEYTLKELGVKTRVYPTKLDSVDKFINWYNN